MRKGLKIPLTNEQNEQRIPGKRCHSEKIDAQSIQGPPFFTVVIPTFNKQEYLGACLTSVLNQSFQNFELIIVDDGSTDGSRAVMEQFCDPRIQIISTTNQGVSAARNTGVASASASLIAFLDADDLWEPDFLNEAHRDFMVDPKIQFWSCGYYFQSVETSRPALFGPDAPTHTGYVNDYFSAALADPIVTSSSVILAKDLLVKIGGFPVGEALGEDLATWARAARHEPLFHHTNILARYRIEGENNHSRLQRAPRRRLLVLEELENAFKSGDLTGLAYFTVYSGKNAYRQARSGRFGYATWIIARSFLINLRHRKFLLALSTMLQTARLLVLMVQLLPARLLRLKKKN